MRETKIRFGLRAWAMIQKEAEADGVSASQFVREAAIMRVVYDAIRREHGPDGLTYGRVVTELRRVLDAAGEEDH